MLSALFAVCLFGLGCIRAFVCFAIIGGSCSFAFFCLGGERLPVVRQLFKPGKQNPELKPETTDQRKQALQIREKLFCRSFAFKK